MKFVLPYGRKKLGLEIEDELVAGVLTSHAEEYKPELSQSELVKRALENPIESERLCDLAKDAETVVIISSDHTRPVPSRITMPLILSEIRSKNPDVEIYILIATGMHRPTTEEELNAKYGEEIVKNEKSLMGDLKMGEIGSQNTTVVQVYLSTPDRTGSPKKSLVAFQKIGLFEGRTGEFQIPIDPFWLRVYDEERQEMVEPPAGTRFILEVGFSSADPNAVKVEWTW